MRLSETQISNITDQWIVDYLRTDTSHLVPRLCHRIPSSDPAGNYYLVSAANEIAKSQPGTALRLDELATAPGALPTETSTTISYAPFAAVKHRTRELIPDETRRPGQGLELNAMRRITRRLLNRLLNDLDAIFVRLFADDDLYAAGNKVTLTTGAAGTSWLSYTSANTDPLGNLRTATDAVAMAIGRRPNVVAMNPTTLRTLTGHPAIADVLQYTTPSVISDSLSVPRVLDLALLETDTVIETAAPGATSSPAYVLRDNDDGVGCAIVAYRPPEGRDDGIASFLWIDCPGPTSGRHGPNVRFYRDDARGGTWADAEICFDLRCPALDGSSLVVGAYLVHKAIC